jgi:hypothetical protein
MGRPQRPASRQEEDAAEAVRFGCPMLYRARTISATGLPAWRCHLGWAIHDEEELARCLETESVEECWRMHLERYEPGTNGTG